MAEKDKVTENKMKRDGVFNFKDTYKFIYNWLNEEGYDVSEDKYQEAISGDSKNIEIKWTAFKKVSDYFKFEVVLSWRVIGLVSVEAEKNGKKIKANKGSFELKVKGTIIKDYEGRWETKPAMKFLRGVYDRYIIKGRIDQYEGKLIKDVSDLIEETKAFLTIEGMK